MPPMPPPVPVSKTVNAMVIGDGNFIAGQAADLLEKDPRITVVAQPQNDAEALAGFSGDKVDAVVFDIGGAPGEAINTISGLLKIDPKAEIIIISTLNFTNVKTAIDALEKGAAEFLQTPAAHTKEQSLATFQHNLTETVYGLGLTRRRDRLPQKKAPATPTFDLRPASRMPPKILVNASSTGGPKALKDVLSGLPLSMSLPILIAQHMPPIFTETLAKNLSSISGRPAGEGKDFDLVKPGHIYVAPGDKHMTVEKVGEDAIIRINQGPPENYCRPSANPLFRSAVMVYGAATLGAVLTGMGKDGKSGAEAIANAGGTIVAQDQESSVVWGMPRAVAEAGICSAVLPLGDIALYLNKLAAR